MRHLIPPLAPDGHHPLMMTDRLLTLYRRLLDSFGPQHWWPGDSPLEIMVGAVLTQNTNWANVSLAIAALKAENFLSLEAMVALPPEILAAAIQPCGYYNLKTARLKNLLSLIDAEYQGELAAMAASPTGTLRAQLLGVKGIGPETADSILLYAFQRPVFVVDTYTFRVLSRHGLIDEEGLDYHELQALFMDALPADPALYNEFHALLVRVGKEFCKKSNPRCARCPLQGL